MPDTEYKISVITPIYNAERYLEETIESVIMQSMDFADIQMILVNDESIDGSADICKKYVDQYPRNIEYISKKNGGVSSARNTGLEYVKGKYIIFLDADDRWEENAFQLIYDFFESRPEEFDVCSCRIRFFGDYEGKDHPLDYKYENGQRVADLMKEPEIISSTIGSVAVRAAAVRNLRFNEKISSGEDSVFVNSLLLEKPYLGILPDALFYYRRNLGSGSGSSSSSRKASWYTVVPDEYYLGLCRKSLEKYGEVMPFIQHVIMYDLRWRKYDASMMSVLTDHEKQQHISIMKEVLSHIDDRVIRKAEGYTQYRRLYLFELRYGYDIPEKAALKDGILRYNKTRLFNFKARNVVRVTVFEFENGGLTIEGVCGIRGIADGYELVAKDDTGNMYTAEISPYEKRDVRGFVGEYVVRGESFRIVMPVISGMTVRLMLRLKDKEIPLVPAFDDYLRIKDNDKTGAADYCFREGYIITDNKGELSVVKDTEANRMVAEAAWKKSINTTEDQKRDAVHNYELELGKIMREAKAGDQVVFVSGRADDILRDNLQRVYDQINLPKAFYSKLDLYWDPEMYKKATELVCAAKVIVTDDYLPMLPSYHKVMGQHIVQLWHATGAFKHFGKDSGSLHPAKDRLYHKDYDLVTVSSESIRQIYADCFRIPVDRVKATGVARTDEVFDEKYREEALARVYTKHPELKNKEIILYAPTFRDIPGTGRERFTPQLDFMGLSEGIGSERVFVLCPHPVMTEPVIAERFDNVLEIRDISTSDMMFAAALLVTDYSSVIFECALMGKPMVFFCYDYDTYERDLYLDMEKELPGPILKTQAELIEYISNSHFNVDSNYESFRTRYIAACDGHSTERIVSLINDMYHDYLISVVMPVYKVEEYLVEAIESVVGQTLGFRSNIQLILVNDGSPDGSAEICKRYKEKYPNNIVYVEKENGGVSSARNAGMDYVRGKYINFMDGDDIWDSDAFRLITEFLREHEDLKIVSGSLEYFGNDTVKSYSMDYVYRKDCVVDIENTSDMPLFGLPKVFFEADTIREHRFDTALAVSEDQLFLTEAVLEQGKFGIVSGAVYYYRKRDDNSSAFDSARERKDFYTVTPGRAFGEIIKRCVEKYGCVIPYIQSVMLVNMRLRIRTGPDGILSENEISDYLIKMQDILQVVSDDIIIGQKRLMFWQRVYLLLAKHYPKYPDDVAKKLLKILRLQVDYVCLDDILVISGNAHEKWISDNLHIYAEDEKGRRFDAEYTECDDNNKTGIFTGVSLKGFRHTLELPLRSGAIYSFYTLDGSDVSRLRLRFAKGIKATATDQLIESEDWLITVDDNKVCITRRKGHNGILERLAALFRIEKNNKIVRQPVIKSSIVEKKQGEKAEAAVDKEAAKKRVELREKAGSPETVLAMFDASYKSLTLENVDFDDVKAVVGDEYLPDISINRFDFEQFRNRFIDHNDTVKDILSFILMFTDWLFFCRDDGYDMDDYFDYEFYRKRREERETFVSANFRDNLRKALNKEPRILTNKMGFLKTFSDFIERPWIDCRSCSFEEFADFIDKSPVIYAKKLGGSGGDGVARIITEKRDTTELFDELRQKKCIAEAAIVQHPELSEFNKDTVNTVRTVTLSDSNNNIRIIGAAIRFGRKGSSMDNFHQGGICALVDPDSGIIISDAVDRNGNRYEVHPDSGKRFRGFRIPEWSRIINKSIAAAATCKESNRLIGWDLAVTEDNSVDIIEGNSRPGFDILQVPDMTGRRAKYEKCVKGLIEPEELYDKETGYWRKKTISI